MERIVQTRNASIRLIEAGAGEPAAVFLHYWGGSARTWRYVTRLLSDRVRCICLDQRGWGQSAASDGRYDLEAMGDDAAAVISALGGAAFRSRRPFDGGQGRPDFRGTPARRARRSDPGCARAPDAHAGFGSCAPSDAGVPTDLGRVSNRPCKSSLFGRFRREDQDSVIEDTLRGLPGAKRAWTDSGMTMGLGERLSVVTVQPSSRLATRTGSKTPQLCERSFPKALPRAEVHVLAGVGHLSPLEAPQELALLLCPPFSLTA